MPKACPNEVARPVFGWLGVARRGRSERIPPALPARSAALIMLRWLVRFQLAPQIPGRRRFSSRLVLVGATILCAALTNPHGCLRLEKRSWSLNTRRRLRLRKRPRRGCSLAPSVLRSGSRLGHRRKRSTGGISHSSGSGVWKSSGECRFSAVQFRREDGADRRTLSCRRHPCPFITADDDRRLRMLDLVQYLDGCDDLNGVVGGKSHRSAGGPLGGYFVVVAGSGVPN